VTIQRAGLAPTATWLDGLAGWRRWAAAGLAGALSALAFAPIYATPVLLVTFPALFWLALGPNGNALSLMEHHAAGRWPRIKRAAMCGWWFGFGFHLFGLYWIGSAFLVEADRFAFAMPFAVTVMPAGLALFSAAALAIASLAPGSAVTRALAMALAMTLAEWLRGNILTGFPWNTLGYALTQPLILMQSAGIIGIYGLTLFTTIFATLPLVIVANPDGGRDRIRDISVAVGLIGIPLAAALIYGAVVLSRPMPPMREAIRLRLVQPNIPQVDKFRLDKHRAIFEQTLALSKSTSTSDGHTGSTPPITHLIWPEAAMPFFALRTKPAIDAIAGALAPHQWLIAGTLRAERHSPGDDMHNFHVFNSTIVLDHNGKLDTSYDKVHLVPFGEYLPFQSALEAIGLTSLTRQRGGFASGATPRRLMRVARLPPLSMMICYEVIFPAMARPTGNRPGLLLNLTNDAWFGPTSGPYQHFQQARVRAVEQGVPLARVANTGISAIIDARGRILRKLGLNQRGVIDSGVPQPVSPPLYAQFGDRLFWLMWSAVAAIVVILSRRDQAQTRRLRA